MSRVVPTGSLPAPLDSTAGVSVIFDRGASPGTSEGTALQMIECVQQALRDARPEVRLVARQDFLRVAFPDLDAAAGDAPSRESLEELFTAGDRRERVVAAGTRYLIVLRGGTTQPSPAGGGFCGAGYGGGGCLGYWQWDRDSEFAASFFDLKDPAVPAEVDVKVSGRPWFMVIGIIPLGAPSFTESWACNKLGAGVAEFVRPGDR